MVKWLTIKEIPTVYPFLTEATVRGLIKNAENNGFKSVLRRIANKTLIDEEKFEIWLNGRQWHKVTHKTKTSQNLNLTNSLLTQ